MDELVSRAVAGDREAFDRLFDLTYEAIVRVVRRRVPNDEVDSVVQETYAKAWQNLHRLRNRSQPLPWLKTIARAECWRSCRRSSLLRSEDLDTLPSDDGDPTAAVDAADSWQRVVKGLDAHSIELLRMRYEKGLSFRAMARLLGMTEYAVTKAVQGALVRARRLLS